MTRGKVEAAMGGTAVPCEARPSTGFVHRDGPCGCFTGGSAPEFGPVRALPTSVPANAPGHQAADTPVYPNHDDELEEPQ